MHFDETEPQENAGLPTISLREGKACYVSIFLRPNTGQIAAVFGTRLTPFLTPPTLRRPCDCEPLFLTSCGQMLRNLLPPFLFYGESNNLVNGRRIWRLLTLASCEQGGRGTLRTSNNRI